MISLICFLFFAALFGVFVVSNRTNVLLSLWPFDYVIQTAVYLPILLSLLIGFLVGLMVCWFSFYKKLIAGKRMLQANNKEKQSQLKAEIEILHAELKAYKIKHQQIGNSDTNEPNSTLLASTALPASKH